MTLNQKLLMFAFVIVMMLLAGCAAHPNPMVHKPGPDGNIAGFWLGLWHGAICPFTFLISLFAKDIHVYEVCNNGGWYNFGFLIGAGALGSTTFKASNKASN